MEKQKKPNVKKTKQNKKGASGLIITLILLVAIVVGVIYLGKFMSAQKAKKEARALIHADVNLNTKESSYYELLYKAMHEHKELIEGAEHVYFDLLNLPDLEYDEKENVAKKVLHTFEVHKDKELLLDTFDGLFFRGILDMETSELKDGIFVSFEDNTEEGVEGTKQFAISIYKSSELNPTLIYNAEVDEKGKILSYEKVSDLMPHENVEGYEEESEVNDENTETEDLEE